MLTPGPGSGTYFGVPMYPMTGACPAERPTRRVDAALLEVPDTVFLRHPPLAIQ